MKDFVRLVNFEVKLKTVLGLEFASLVALDNIINYHLKTCFGSKRMLILSINILYTLVKGTLYFKVSYFTYE